MPNVVRLASPPYCHFIIRGGTRIPQESHHSTNYIISWHATDSPAAKSDTLIVSNKLPAPVNRLTPVMHHSLFNVFILCTAVFLAAYPLRHGGNECQWTAAHLWFLGIVFFALLAVALTLYTRTYAKDQSAMVAVHYKEQIRDQPLHLPCQETQLQTGPSKMVPGR